MFNLIHNKINSNYFIINIKLNFPKPFDSNENYNYINFKKKYIIIIEKWIKNILDKYSLMSNWVLYITNLNFNTIRIFIYLNSLNYSNMDDKHLIYLSDMINYETMFKLNIHDLSKLFSIDKLNLLIDLELGLIKTNLDEDSNEENSSDDESFINLFTNNLINNSNNDSNNNSNNNLEEPKSLTKINTFDIIDFNYFTKHQLSNKQLMKQYEELCINNRFNIISDIGISGLNKVTFFNELSKLNCIQQSNLYSNKSFNIYSFDLYTKIKENNKFYWIKYNSNDLNNQVISLIFNHNSQ